MTDLIVNTQVKEAAGEQSVASDFYEALDEEVEELIETAAERARANDRKTLQAKDL
jgi:histone H3/H4